MSTNLKYFITGANRGIGKGLVTILLQRPATTVIATVRDLSSNTTEELRQLPTAKDSKLIVLKLDSAIENDAFDAVTCLTQTHGITSLDVVVANAGISHSGKPVAQTSVEAALEHFSVNSIAPLILFRATASLLKASKSGRSTFVALSSIIGSIGGMELLAGFPAKLSPYGASKAALNWLVRRIQFEEPWLISFVIHPGLVLSDMGSAAVKETGADPIALGAISVEESAKAILKSIDEATPDTSGTFQSYNGGILPW
ncbi:hypothetical protein N7539_001428 [Penicillium diatomitis]|uniref:Uncharacterized protein n=1 Tax=Penicillium diatomitis TaxID=2819901 RepID=A0A9X0BZL5_9EURO|nr:uncharacterized protein N7539_001428 [Penicillium diatomitis]KAJ5492682.1 hypothetical protein N7539_001428 [Penicillium diatomitis]